MRTNGLKLVMRYFKSLLPERLDGLKLVYRDTDILDFEILSELNS